VSHFFLSEVGPLGMLVRTPAATGKLRFMGSTPLAPVEGAPTKNSGQLFAACYSDLKDLAERQLRRSSGVPVSPTTLLHEAYLGMVGRDTLFQDRGRFMGYVARVMRGLIIDLARERRALKRGSGFHITQLPNESGKRCPKSANWYGCLMRLMSSPRATRGSRKSWTSNTFAAIPLRKSPPFTGFPSAPCSATGKKRALCSFNRCKALHRFGSWIGHRGHRNQPRGWGAED
jgi:hypothetical protein